MDLSPQVLIGGAAALLAVISTLILVASRRRPEGARAEVPRAPTAPQAKAGSWDVFRAGLAKTRESLGARLKAAVQGGATVDARVSNLEEALILADVGVATTQKLLSGLGKVAATGSPSEVLNALKVEMADLLGRADGPSIAPGAAPLVILVAGVNGVGKTTSIAKLARLYRNEGQRVVLGAADTFRAAAIEQLEVWAQRVGADFVKHQSGSDPSAVAFDAVRAAKSRGADVVIIDTAGRLHVKENLMEELKKVVRVIAREAPGAPHETYLVLDATTGQNSLKQAKQFVEALPVTGVILTKLDGTAKGGAVMAISAELGLPVRYVGMGEGMDDLRPFDPRAFVEAIFEG